ncbi:MAG: hypothetical protein LW630_01945 [Saprospiraceae bacterium]|jgi:hypothetical protein|nr:hypothetical protein [Saprospiraceae bacterium]
MDAGNLTPELVQSFAHNRISLSINENLALDMMLKQLHIGVPSPHLPRTPFTIVLVSKGVFMVYPQHMYTIEWEGLGQFDLFLVPVGPDQEGMQYEAVFG